MFLVDLRIRFNVSFVADWNSKAQSPPILHVLQRQENFLSIAKITGKLLHVLGQKC